MDKIQGLCCDINSADRRLSSKRALTADDTPRFIADDNPLARLVVGALGLRQEPSSVIKNLKKRLRQKTS